MDYTITRSLDKTSYRIVADNIDEAWNKVIDIDKAFREAYPEQRGSLLYREKETKTKQYIMRPCDKCGGHSHFMHTNGGTRKLPDRVLCKICAGQPSVVLGLG